MIENMIENEESRKAEVGRNAEEGSKSKVRISKVRISKARIQEIATFVIVGVVLVGLIVGTIMLMMSER